MYKDNECSIPGIPNDNLVPPWIIPEHKRGKAQSTVVIPKAQRKNFIYFNLLTLNSKLD